MPQDNPAAAPLPAASPPEPPWTRRDDKLLELLLLSRSGVGIDTISNVVGRTPEQVLQRRDSIVAGVRHVLGAMELRTPREWDIQMAAAAAAAAEEEEREVVVLAMPVAAEDDGSTAPMVVGIGGSGGKRSNKGQGRNKRRTKGAKKKKTAVMWKEEEHRAFLAGLREYKGNWKGMSMKYVPTKTPGQIASHYQKFCIRGKQRERNGCKRASIHDITDPGSFAAVAGGGEAAAPAPARACTVRRASSECSDPVPGEEDEPRSTHGSQALASTQLLA